MTHRAIHIDLRLRQLDAKPASRTEPDYFLLADNPTGTQRNVGTVIVNIASLYNDLKIWLNNAGKRYQCTKCKNGFDSPVCVESVGNKNKDRTLQLPALSASELATILHGLRPL
jgi:hypothetical protein